MHYLRDANLLEPALRFFENAYVDKNTEDHARALKQSTEDSAEVVAIIQEIRAAVQAAWSNGSLALVPSTPPPNRKRIKTKRV